MDRVAVNRSLEKSLQLEEVLLKRPQEAGTGPKPNYTLAPT